MTIEEKGRFIFSLNRKKLFFCEVLCSVQEQIRNAASEVIENKKINMVLLRP